MTTQAADNSLFASSAPRRAPRHPLTTTSLALSILVGAAIGLQSGVAIGACEPDAPPLADGASVTCTGADETGFDASAFTDVTITTSGVTSLDDSSALNAAILVGDDSNVTIGADATITVIDTNGAGVRGSDRNAVQNDGAIIVDGADSVGIDVGSIDIPDPTPSTDVINLGTITLNGLNSIGIRSVDNYILTNDEAGLITIEAGATGGIGILGVDDNFVTSNGTITIDATDAIGISVNQNTGVALPNGAVFGASSVTTINGDRSIGMQVGDNVGTAYSGTIDLVGDMTIGVSIGNKVDPFAAANHTNTNTATINVTGTDSYGIRAGDGWVTGSDENGTFVPTSADIRNFGTINVDGDRSFGIFAGDIANTSGNHNGFVLSSRSTFADVAVINVNGTDAVGISVGGNDLLDHWDFDDPTANVVLFNVNNTGGTITGSADAGPLVIFRDFTAGKENRLLSPDGSSILADLTNLGTTDRGIAIRGSNGDEFIVSGGEIRGDVQLMDGDDRIVLNDTYVQSGGMLYGGNGSDELYLGFISGSVGVFDATILDGFERIEVDGRNNSSGATSGWTIQNGAGFTGTTSIRPSGRLVVPLNAMNVTQAVTLGGNLEIDPTGSVSVAPDGTTTPLTVLGTAQLSGTLLVNRAQIPLVTGSTRLVTVVGGITDTFTDTDIPRSIGTTLLTEIYSPNAIDLVITTRSFEDVANSANRAAAGRHFDDILEDGTTPLALSDVITELDTVGDVLNVFDAISPEPYDAQTTILIESQSQLARLLLDRPRDCSEGELDPWQGSRAPLGCHSRELAAWATATGSVRNRDSFKGHNEYDADSYGITLGVDLNSISDLDLTVAASGQRAQVDVSGAGKSDITIATLSGLASWSPGPLRIQGVASYGFGSHEDRRDFGFNESATPVSARASDQHESHTLGLSGQAGYLFNVGPLAIEPVTGFDYAWVNQGEIKEKNASVWGLVIDDRHDHILTLRAGVQLSTVYHHTKYIATELLFLDGIWRPTLDLGWRQTVTGYDRELTARLSGAPSGVSDFTIEGEEDRNGFEFGAGLSFVPDNANRLQFDLRYEGYRGSSTLEHDLIAKIRLGF